MAEKLILSSDSVAFSDRVAELSGIAVTLCEQCATCSGSCPMVDDMDITPAEMVRMATVGDERVLDTKTMWICAACFTCTARCPRNLDVAKIAEALRQIKLRKSIDFLSIKEMTKEELEELPQIALVSAFRKFVS